MTDDELQTMWIAGAPIQAMVAATGRNRINLVSHIRRLRRREGEQRWPKRMGGPIPPKPSQPRPQRAGAVTLPPLASLSE